MVMPFPLKTASDPSDSLSLRCEEGRVLLARLADGEHLAATELLAWAMCAWTTVLAVFDEETASAFCRVGGYPPAMLASCRPGGMLARQVAFLEGQRTRRGRRESVVCAC